MRFALIGIFSLLLASPSAPSVDDPVTIARDTTVSLAERQSRLAEMARSDDSGRSAVELARLNFDPLKKKEAVKWLRVGLRQARDSAYVRAAQAEFLWRAGSRHDSFISARHAITLDPNNIDALYLAGRYALWRLIDPDVLTFRGEHRYFPGPGVLTNAAELSARSVSDFESDAEEYLERAEEIAPNHWPSTLTHLRLLARQQKQATLLRRIDTFTRSNPAHLDARLALLAVQESVSQIELAHRSAVHVIGALKRQAVVPEPFLPLDNEPWETSIEEAWAGGDPLRLTPLNERLTEHIRRLALAYFRFGDPLTGTTGWEAVPGKALIRYGLPKEESNDLSRFGAAQALAGLSRSDLTATTSMLVWTYDTFSIRFRRTHNQWRYVHAKHPLREVNRLSTSTTEEASRGYGRLLDWDELIERIPERYNPHTIDTQLQVAQFKGEGNKTRLAIHVGLDADSLPHTNVAKGAASIDIRRGIWLSGKAWQPDRHEVPLKMLAKTQIGGKHWLVINDEVEALPGDLELSYEVVDASGISGKMSRLITVRDMSEEELAMSDILILKAHRPRVSLPTTLDDYTVLPNPEARWFDRHLPIYFEAYGLSVDADGNSSCKLTLEARDKGEWKVIESVQKRRKGDQYGIGWRLHSQARNAKEIRLRLEDTQSGRSTIRALSVNPAESAI